MPNWCEGIFRARGELGNIKRFIEEGLGAVEGDSLEVIGEERYEEDIAMDYEIKTEHGLVWLKDTHRHFLDFSDWDYLTVYWNNKREAQIVAQFQAAWDINEMDISKISKEYGIAIKVNGFERGIEFEHSVETTANGMVKESVVKRYENYGWDCAMPLLGG